MLNTPGKKPTRTEVSTAVRKLKGFKGVTGPIEFDSKGDPIKAKYFVMIMGAIAFLSSIGSSGSRVSNVAHLGGMLFGYLYLRMKMPSVNTRNLMDRYQTWKLQRARKRFQVYMRKHKSDRDPWVQ